MTKSIRQVYGETLASLGASHPELVVLDADVSASTQTKFFANAYPERFFDMGIAEANMVATAAGLAQQGFVPFVNTFAVFLSSIGLLPTRTLACYGELNVKLAGGYCGVSDAADGATHHATEDISIIRALPNMKVICPSDPISTAKLTQMVLETQGPCYLRLSRDVYPDLYSDDTAFQFGRGNIVRKGTDVTVIACGILVHKAMEAAEALQTQGISVQVVDMYSIKPIDEELICRVAADTGAIVTAEEHNVIGGLGSAVAECLVRAGIGVPVQMVGVNDTFTESGSYDSLLNKYKLDSKAVSEAVVSLLSKKRNV